MRAAHLHVRRLQIEGNMADQDKLLDEAVVYAGALAVYSDVEHCQVSDLPRVL